MNIRRLVLQVDRARPRPSLIEMGRAISELPGIEGFNITVTDVDDERDVAGVAAGDRIVPHVPGLRS